MTTEASQTPKGSLRRWLRNYTRGLLILFVIVLVVRLLWAIWPPDADDAFEAWLTAGTEVWVLTAAGVLLLPVLLGWAVEALLYPILWRRRHLRGLLAFESGLVTELEPGESRAAAVVLVDWPRPDVRSIGLATSVFPDPDTGAELAAVLLPNGPDLRKGNIRIVPRDKVCRTDWSLREYLVFQLSYGAAAPDSTPTDAQRPQNASPD